MLSLEQKDKNIKCLMNLNFQVKLQPYKRQSKLINNNINNHRITVFFCLSWKRHRIIGIAKIKIKWRKNTNVNAA